MLQQTSSSLKCCHQFVSTFNHLNLPPWLRLINSPQDFSFAISKDSAVANRHGEFRRLLGK
jgi:hypothetical protein